jgi:putative membrane protein
VAQVARPWPYFFAPLLLVAASAIFECIEAIVVEMVNPDLGTIFLGAQGDIWDAQKDIIVALYGGALAMLAARLTETKGAPPRNQGL